MGINQLRRCIRECLDALRDPDLDETQREILETLCDEYIAQLEQLIKEQTND
jgi:hypothetical protein